MYTRLGKVFLFNNYKLLCADNKIKFEQTI